MKKTAVDERGVSVDSTNYVSKFALQLLDFGMLDVDSEKVEKGTCWSVFWG